MEEKEYNDIESLAAYLHSDKFKERNKPEEYKAEKERERKNPAQLSPAAKASVRNSARKPVVQKNESIDDFLFSIENKKKRQSTSPAPVKAERKPAEAKPSEEKAPVRNEPSEKKEIVSLADSITGKEHEPAVAVSAPDKTQIIRTEQRPAPVKDTPVIKDELSDEFDYDEDMSDEEMSPSDNSATRMMAPVGRDTAPITEEEEEEDPSAKAERRRLVQLRRKYEKQKQRVRTFAYVLLSVFLSVVILGVSAYASTYIVTWAQDLTGIASTEFKIDVEIPENADIETVAALLSENNIISSPKFFKLFADFTGKNKNFIPGSYTLSSTMPYSTLLSTICTETQEKKTVTVRIVEGMTAREIGQLLEENYVCFAEDFEKFYKNVQSKYDFERRVKESPYKFNQLEGYLFPDTYEFYIVNSIENGCKPINGQTQEEAEEQMHLDSLENAEAAAEKMYSNFNDKITREMYKKMGEMNMTLDEVMALASMVQKEAASVEDMQAVAGVFLNRIRNSAEFPNLQSDVTVLYIENDIKPYIKDSEASKTKLYNSYNTYVCEGIPSGAICNPGLDAIEAVLANIPSEYYYFCANEETGEVFYAKTISEHEQNLILAELAPTEQEENYIE